ncbi:hypothetical protein AusDCA_2450 [Desulfitobacterium sp. AusDCA]
MITIDGCIILHIDFFNNKNLYEVTLIFLSKTYMKMREYEWGAVGVICLAKNNRGNLFKILYFYSIIWKSGKQTCGLKNICFFVQKECLPRRLVRHSFYSKKLNKRQNTTQNTVMREL